ncbi:MAG: caspase family protein [Tychonema bourrellyi B0820]|uniref:caspase family protein n=1 Tax=Tychonema bourrellyi TaxID=54313 RepID=UPI0015D50603|nr:caspase family protein [Tychonema bourrellyi]MDQ2097076.1 caspase family protein [Tychonema bourrellyi B0820]
MASNWAIVIGINQYRFLQPLKYAKRDAETIHSFLMQEAKFDRIFLFTDDSPPISGKPTEPFRANLLRVLRQIFATPFMKDGDNFWFFFSGHGIPHNGQDYLMPLDGDPEDIENTGISTNTITNYLRSCGADNAVMILDACRSSGKKSGEGIGRQTEAEARQTGVISFFSCSPDQYSYELEAITQGAFTHALLEGLGIRGRCATVERLNQYLENRVPTLVSQYLGKARQIPYTIAEPLNRSHLILMPQHASLADIATLKNDAYRAERQQDWDLAQRLWIRINAAASGQDMEAIEALQNLGIQRPSATPVFPSTTSNPSPEPVPKSRSSPPINGSKQPPVPRALTRQQFLKLVIPASVGVVGVTLANQFLGRSPQTSPSPTSDTPSSPQPPRPSPSSSDSPSPQPTPLNPPSPSLPAKYSRLAGLLKAKYWKAANQETIELMKKEKGIGAESTIDFPCEVLNQIDRLWVESSDGKFGFTVQQKILLVDCSNMPSVELAQTCFAHKVGWLGQGDLDAFGKLIYIGHFPYITVDGDDGVFNQVQRLSAVLQRLISCGT